MLRNAIRAYNRAVDRMMQSGAFTDVPLKTSFKKERERLSDKSFDRHTLYQRVKDLRAATPSVDKNAAAPVIVKVGDVEKTVPRYLKNQLSKLVRTVNIKRRKLRQTIYPDWDSMSRVEQLTHASNKNILDLPEATSRDMGKYLDEVTAEKFRKDQSYMDMYLDMWQEYSKDHPGFSQTVENIKYLVENNPDAVSAILEADYDETKLDYIYIDSHYPEKITVRQNRVVDFWAKMRAKYGSGTAYSGWESMVDWKFETDGDHRFAKKEGKDGRKPGR